MVFRKCSSHSFSTVLTFFQDGWMALRFHWRTSEDGLCLLSEPYLSHFKNAVMPVAMSCFFLRLYFSYNAATRQTTIMTTDLNQLHLSMIQRLKGSSEMTTHPEKITQLLTQCFAVVGECFAAAAMVWDASSGRVHCRNLLLYMYEMY